MKSKWAPWGTGILGLIGIGGGIANRSWLDFAGGLFILGYANHLGIERQRKEESNLPDED